MGLYLRPERLEEALEALEARPLAVLAGGTDFYPARVGKALDEDVLDITALEGLELIEDRGDHWAIGARVTWSDLLEADLPACFDGLKTAARAVGGRQVQNVATLIGNLVNASPAADGAPCLMALDAAIALRRAGGERRLPLTELIVGNRRTLCAPGELATHILVPKPAPGARASFIKLGARRYLVISIVMAAVVLEPEDGPGDGPGDVKVARARVCIGACAPVARRLPALEAALVGRPLDRQLGDAVEAEHLESVLAPIDDVRGSAAYRLDAAATAVRRALAELT